VALTMIPRRMRTTQAEVADTVSGNGRDGGSHSGDIDRELVP
jgi:hypothetical protein